MTVARISLDPARLLGFDQAGTAGEPAASSAKVGTKPDAVPPGAKAGMKPFTGPLDARVGFKPTAGSSVLQAKVGTKDR